MVSFLGSNLYMPENLLKRCPATEGILVTTL